VSLEFTVGKQIDFCGIANAVLLVGCDGSACATEAIARSKPDFNENQLALGIDNNQIDFPGFAAKVLILNSAAPHF
jgi:hypothetical protein